MSPFGYGAGFELPPKRTHRPCELNLYRNETQLHLCEASIQKKHLNSPLFSVMLNALRQEIRHIRMMFVLLRSKIPHWKIDILLKQAPFL